MAFLSNMDDAARFAAKMRALTNMEMPEEAAMRSLRKKRGQQELLLGVQELGPENSKEILVAEIKGLASDIPQSELRQNAFLRSAMFEIENEDPLVFSFEELQDYKRMLEATRRRLGFVGTSPPRE